MTTRKPPLSGEQGGGVAETMAAQQRIGYRGERSAGDRGFAKSGNGSLPVGDYIFTHWNIYYEGMHRVGLPYESEVRAFVGGWELCTAFEATLHAIGRDQNMDLAMEVRGIARKEYDAELAAMLDAVGVPVVEDEHTGLRLARHLEGLRHLANMSSLELLVHAAGEVERETKDLIVDRATLRDEVLGLRAERKEISSLQAKAVQLEAIQALLLKGTGQ